MYYTYMNIHIQIHVYTHTHSTTIFEHSFMHPLFKFSNKGNALTYPPLPGVVRASEALAQLVHERVRLFRLVDERKDKFDHSAEHALHIKT